ncbi:nucleoporin Nup43 [Prorops nasuta]|uniref:nucleoporin Nup43 n=1 Tax=Prorops nasuta TaxID=863751 RepID=UPI0034CEFFD1
MDENIQGKFVSEKISKIRWKPEEFADPHYFLTGSWDNPVNKITYWSFEKGDDDEAYPLPVTSYDFKGDVTEIKFISKNLFAASSSLGFVKLLQLVENGAVQFQEHNKWDNLHSFKTLEPAACTGISNFQHDVVTVGEDGRINYLTASHKKPIKVIENADSCSIQCVDFPRYNEILTGNLRGHIKVWDFRGDHDIPVTSFMLSDQAKVEATSIVHHPTQRHIIVAGGGDGSITFWDLRQINYPIPPLNAHEKAINEILFHPDRPENLFTCSMGGELWHWNDAKNSKLKLDTTDSHWISMVGTGGKDVTPLCGPLHKPINSIDINRSMLLFGCDNEAIYIVKNIPL